MRLFSLSLAHVGDTVDHVTALPSADAVMEATTLVVALALAKALVLVADTVRVGGGMAVASTAAQLSL